MHTATGQGGRGLWSPGPAPANWGTFQRDIVLAAGGSVFPFLIRVFKDLT